MGQAAIPSYSFELGQSMFCFLISPMISFRNSFIAFPCGLASFNHATIVCIKMPAGFGLVADNTIKTICNMMGTEDQHRKVIRRETNCYNLLQAFIFGLTKQNTYQQIANETRLNLGELIEGMISFGESMRVCPTARYESAARSRGCGNREFIEAICLDPKDYRLP